MRFRISLTGAALGAAIIAVLSGWHSASNVAAQVADLDLDAKDVEILGHGPIHEAFAQPASPTLESNAVIKKKPRDPIEELPPDVKPQGDNVVWIPGYWAFDGERDDFIWISGFWRNVPPDRVWVGGYWLAEGDGARWVAGYWSGRAEQQVYYPPPPEVVVEAQPAVPNDSSFYVAGTWVYRDTRYLWRPGYWTPYRAGWLWTQPHYSWTPGGYIFVDGYWDYDFNRRGVLFAPAYFGPQYFGGNRFYRPSYALSTDLLYASLFIRPNAGFYYFGDYYGARYAGLGYSPWVDYRYRGRYADPAWSYYAWQNRNTPRWEEQMRASYVSRQRGDTPPPPRRIDAQAKSTQQQNVNVTQNVNLVVPIQQLQARKDSNLRTITKDESVAIQKNAEESRRLTKTRQSVDAKIDAKASRQQAVRSDLALPKVAAATGKSELPPPPPVVPQLDAKATAPKTKEAKDAQTPAVPPVTTPKGKDTPPTADKDKTPKVPPTPKVEPKANPIPKVAPPPVVPQPKVTTPVPPPVKTEPKSNPIPKVDPPAPNVPQPKVNIPSPPVKIEPQVNPIPKSVPPPQIPPQPKSLPPAPVPLKTLPAPKAPPAPKSAPPQPVVAPPVPPRIEPPATSIPRPEVPKRKGKEKE